MSRQDKYFKKYITVDQEGWTGYVHNDFKQFSLSCLIDPDISDERRNLFEKVHSSDNSKVYRYSIRSQQGNWETLYLKKYLNRSVADNILSVFRPSRAERAFMAGFMLEKHHLHTPEVVAFFQKKDGLFSTEDILITRAMTNAIALPEVLVSNRTNQGLITPKDKAGMIVEFGRFVGNMHAAGICHGDMSWWNIFVAKQCSGWEFYLIDNERTRKYFILPFWLRRKNLVQLYIEKINLTRTDQMRFWLAYIEKSKISYRRSKSIAKAVFKRTKKRLFKRTQKYIGLQTDKLQSHWNINRVRSGNCNGFLLNEFCNRDKAAAFLQQTETLIQTGVLLKNDIATRLVRCTYNNWDIVIKRYNHQGFWHSLRYTIKGSRAKKCWRFGHLMTVMNIPCAAPLGVIEQRKYGLIWQSYIINVFIEGPNINNYFLRPELPQHEKLAVLAKTKMLTTQLIENNLVHNDLKPSNILIQANRPVLIDLDSMLKFKNRWILSLYKRKMDNKIKTRILDENTLSL